MKKISDTEVIRQLQRAHRQSSLQTPTIEENPDDESARRFMARLLLQATLPHSKPEGTPA